MSRFRPDTNFRLLRLVLSVARLADHVSRYDRLLGHVGSHGMVVSKDTCVRSKITIGHEQAHVPKHPLN
jgi:hypothetical protein